MTSSTFSHGFLSTCVGLVLSATLDSDIAAQEVSVDTTFNPGDIGYGNGDGGTSPYEIVIQPDGKVLSVGMASDYNGTTVYGIARVDTSGLLDDSFDCGTGASSIRTITLQPDGKILVAGGFMMFNGVSAPCIARLDIDGSLDSSFDPGLGGGTITKMGLQTDGKVVLGGGFTSFGGVSSNRITRVLADGGLDPSFDMGTGFNAWVNDLVLQPDGKILVSGSFTEYDGVARNGIARINLDGSLDASFDPGVGPDTLVKCLALQPDGKILIGGLFTTFTGLNRGRIARLNSDGSLDTTFALGGGANGWINNVALQPDGKILVVGYFTSYDSIPAQRIARLNADGTLDSTFNSGSGAAGPPADVLVQPDGKILIAGNHYSYDGISRKGIARLHNDGSLDLDFNRGSGANWHVTDIVALPNGQSLVSGAFSTYNGTPLNGLTRVEEDGTVDTTFLHGTIWGSRIHQLAVHQDGSILMVGAFVPCPGMPGGACEYIDRLNPDGSPDSTFTPGGGADNWINCAAIQPDDRIIIGGLFSSYDSTARNRIARLNFDGSLDTSFDPGSGADYAVYSVAVQPDGKILIGGDFNVFDGFNRPGMARLNVDGSVDTSFDPGSGPDWRIYSIIPLADGKILIGGLFASYNGAPCNRIARLNSDGSFDTTFDPGYGASGPVFELLLEPDGHIMLVGDFWSYDNIPRYRIARINSDGSLDPSYDTSEGADETVLAIAIDQQNRVLIGGEFTSYDGIGRNRVARLKGGGNVHVVEFAAAELVVWPNPASNVLNLPAPMDVAVLDTQGRIVIGETKRALTLATQDLDPGVYLLRERSGRSARFIKQ